MIIMIIQVRLSSSLVSAIMIIRVLPDHTARSRTQGFQIQGIRTGGNGAGTALRLSSSLISESVCSLLPPSV
eukprot:770527-Rhodomonas_salina.1